MADAGPILREITESLEKCGLEAILVGNAAAALQGAPVTTLAFDFMFRRLQIDFMPILHGIRSFESLKSRAVRVSMGQGTLLVADLADIIRSKRALGRPKDLAVLDILEKTRDEKKKK